METEEETISLQIPNFLKDYYNLFAIGLIIAAFVVRMIYININQAVWWDEAVYLLQAKHYIYNTINTGWWAGKGFILPMVLAALFKISGGANLIAARFMEILFSMGTLFFTYLISKKFLGKKVAVISMAFLSVVWLDIFYSVKILSDIPSTFFVILSFWLLIKDEEAKKNSLILSGALLLLAGMFRFNAWVMGLPFLIYIIWFSRKKLKWFLIGAAAVAAIYMLICFFMYGNPLYEPIENLVTNVGGGKVDFFYYFSALPGIFTWPVVILFVLSLLLNWNKKKNLFMIISIFAFILIFSAVKFFDFRYIYYIFPFFCIVSSSGIFSLISKIKAEKYFVIVGFLIFLLVAFLQISFVNQQLNDRAYSYVELKQASEWVKRNSPSDTVIMSISQPQVTYYSERATIQFPGTEAEFIQLLNEKKPNYGIISVYETHPGYIQQLLNKTYNNITVINEYKMHGTDQASAALIKFNY